MDSTRNISHATSSMLPYTMSFTPFTPQGSTQFERWNNYSEPIFALLVTFPIYATVFFCHTRFSVKIYSKYQRMPAAKAIKAFVLIAHIVSGLSEILRWHSRRWSSGELPQADGVDVMLCLAQSVTNMVLVKHLARGLPIMTSVYLLFSSTCIKTDTCRTIIPSRGNHETSHDIRRMVLFQCSMAQSLCSHRQRLHIHPHAYLSHRSHDEEEP